MGCFWCAPSRTFQHHTGHFVKNSKTLKWPLNGCAWGQSCPTLFDLMRCSPPGSSAHGIFQARVLEWAAYPRGSCWPRDWAHISCSSALAGEFFAPVPPGKPLWLDESSWCLRLQDFLKDYSCMMWLVRKSDKEMEQTWPWILSLSLFLKNPISSISLKDFVPFS